MSYLVMTASDAAERNERFPHSIRSLNALLETRAHDSADVVCVGFVTGDGSTYETLTFAQLFDELCSTAYALAALDSPLKARRRKEMKQKSVALLAPSCRDFLVHVFALLRLGYRVLLVAPQNTPNDIAHLCQAVGAERLIYHASMSDAALASGFKSQAMLDSAAVNGTIPSPSLARSELSPEEESETDCVVFHSSGSSGTPKPIPQKHKVWTRAACCKPHSPSFTTTPLFHGGISDLFRSMMSKSTLYMYPSTMPVTADRLQRAFDSFQSPATSFLSVPYILDLFAEETSGMETLARLELVSTGGSPMPPVLGDRLCQAGVKLVSRYGSSECGFLMSSYREFAIDQDWSFLRTTEGSERWLRFEDQGDGTFELVVPADWPTLSKSNRSDGSYATSDLFVRHQMTPHAWRLTGRADDVILMSNGEKSSPAPIEATIAIASCVKEALVFGSDRPSLGVAVVPTSPSTTLEEIIPIVQEANRAAPAHSQIPHELIVILDQHATFPKASKGSLQRGRAYEAFASQIDDAYRRYASGSVNSDSAQMLAGSELRTLIRQLVLEGYNGSKTITDDDDLFNAGVDSLQAVRIRNALARQVNTGAPLPMNIVFECGSIERFIQCLTSNLRDADQLDDSLARRIGSMQAGSDAVDADLELMRDLTQPGSPLLSFAPSESLALPRSQAIQDGTSTGWHCILTGATGSLGAQIVPLILDDKRFESLTCLVRAAEDDQATARVIENVRRSKLTLDRSKSGRMQCLASRLDDVKLGLADDAYASLASRKSIVIHSAWPVHFGAGLQSFVQHLHGLRNLVNLARVNEQSRMFFCSSTAAVLGQHASRVPEAVSHNPLDAVAIGYARSKHIAETICSAAFGHGLDGRVGILRLGQLSADTQHGIWKVDEGWPLLIASASCVGCLPDLDETLSWLPVDCAAHAVVDIVAAESEPVAEVPVFHVVSTSKEVTYRSLLDMLRRHGLRFDVVKAALWLDRLKNAEKEGAKHPSLKMLDVWQRNYGAQQQAEINFETSRATRLTSALGHALTDDDVAKMLAYWREAGLLCSV